jgi:hypothetical protein
MYHKCNNNKNKVDICILPLCRTIVCDDEVEDVGKDGFRNRRKRRIIRYDCRLVYVMMMMVMRKRNVMCASMYRRRRRRRKEKWSRGEVQTCLSFSLFRLFV